MKLFTLFFCLFALSLIVKSTFAHNIHRPDGHAPIGVMADHTHKKGEVMFSYRYMQMSMEDLTDGSDTISQDDYFNDTSYMMAPQNMSMNMHMIGTMYAISDTSTFSMMVPYINKEMTMVRKMNDEEVDSVSNGIGDIKINWLYNLIETTDNRFVLRVGLSLPTGSIEKHDNSIKLAIPMQMGTGSYGVIVSGTYSYFTSFGSFGTQLQMTKYLNENTDEYQLGNEYLLNFWAMYNLNESLGVSARIEQNSKDPVDDNRDASMVMSSIFETSKIHGTRRDLFLGVNYISTSGLIKGHRLALELGKPIGFDLAGYQLKNQERLVFGWQKAY